MKIDVSKLREFFRRTGQVKEVSWDENIFIEKPKVKTIQPDIRLSFNDTFLNINKQLNERQSKRIR
jgi:hypothetical protein